jgi:hypothetical protein
MESVTVRSKSYRGLRLGHLLQTSWSENLFGAFAIFQFRLNTVFKNDVVKLSYVAVMNSSFFVFGTVAAVCDSGVSFRRKSSPFSAPYLSSHNSRIRKWLEYHIHHFAKTVFLSFHMNTTCSWRDRPRNQIGWQPLLPLVSSLHWFFTLTIYLPFFISSMVKSNRKGERRKILRVSLSTQTKENVAPLMNMGSSPEDCSRCLLVSGDLVLVQWNSYVREASNPKSYLASVARHYKIDKKAFSFVFYISRQCTSSFLQQNFIVSELL